MYKKKRPFGEDKGDHTKRRKQSRLNKDFNPEFKYGDKPKQREWKELYKYVEGRKVITYGINYDHLMAVMGDIADYAGTEFGRDIQEEIETGTRSELGEKQIMPNYYAVEKLGAEPNEQNFRELVESNRIGPLTAAEKEQLKRLIKNYDKDVDAMKAEWAGRRKNYVVDSGKCITAIMTTFVNEAFAGLLKSDPGYTVARNSNDVSEFIRWFKCKTLEGLGLDDDRKEEKELKELLGSEREHLTIRQAGGTMNYIMKIDRLLKQLNKLQFERKKKEKAAKLAVMDDITKELELEEMLDDIKTANNTESSFIKVIFTEIRDNGNQAVSHSDTLKSAIRNKQLEIGISSCEPPYTKLDVMLQDMRKLANTAMRESIAQRNLNHVNKKDDRNGRRDNDLLINNQVTDKGVKVCWFCRDQLNNENAAKLHTWYNCRYNSKSKSYVGEKRKKLKMQEAKQKVQTEKDKIEKAQEEKVIAILKKHIKINQDPQEPIDEVNVNTGRRHG